MTKKAQHTATPWQHDPTGRMGRPSEIFSGGRPIAECGLTSATAEDAANAELIVRAVNSHAELLAACINAEHALIQRARDLPGVWDGALAQLQTAISKAEGRTA